MDTIQPDMLRALLDQNKARLRHSKSYSPVPGVTRQAWWVDEHPVQEGGSGIKGYEISKAQYEELARQYPQFVDNAEFREYHVDGLDPNKDSRERHLYVVAECVEQALTLAAFDGLMKSYLDLRVSRKSYDPTEGPARVIKLCGRDFCGGTDTAGPARPTK